MESDPEKVNFGKGILVLPVEYTKGLEFDAVLIWNPTREDYPTDDGDAKLLYVAATRALHELHILYRDSLTGLIADPLPEKSNFTAVQIEANHAEIQDRTEVAFRDKPKKKATPKVIIAPNKPLLSLQDAKPKPLQNKMFHTISPATTVTHQSVKKVFFGDMPATERLRPAGHAKINLSVRWVSKQPDGLYLQSQYGTMRISPVSSSIIRMTFAKGAKITDGTHALISINKVEKGWKYRDTGKAIELTTGEVTVRVEKISGAVSYLDSKGTVLLTERKQESRILESERNFLFLDWQKGEQLFAMGPEGQGGLKVRGSARYISHNGALPFLLSDKGYGILPLASEGVICCDIPAYGSYLSMEGQGQQDYYFIAGKQQQNIVNAYAYLCGTL